MAMPTLAYVNGDIRPIAEASVSVLDRGFLFGDGIYEVAAVLDGQMVDLNPHMARLERSMGEIGITPPMDRAALKTAMEELIAAEGLTEGFIYQQITRGADAKRDFPFPDAAKVPSTLVMFCQELALRDNPKAKTGGTAITIPEIRWARRDIKSTSLLAQVLGKQAAVEAGAAEGWMIEDGYITEGTSSAACIVTQDGTLVTRPVSNDVLDSITRRAVLVLCEETQVKVEERLFTADEAYAAKEAFTASASALVMPIVEIDGHKIGDGTPGALSTRLREIYLDLATSREFS